MKIIHIIPGSGDAFYCQNCLRDGSLVAALRAKGHDVLVAPMYLPLFTDQPDVAGNSPVFYGAANIYLKETFPLLRRIPRAIEALLDSPAVLDFAARKARSTRARGLERMTLSVLRGEDGRQAAELERLVRWLYSRDKPDLVHLSNALLSGLAGRIKRQLDVPVICSLQDEDSWVDAMEPEDRTRVWETMARKAADVDAFVAVSRSYAETMKQRLQIPPDRMHVVHIGIPAQDYPQAPMRFDPPVIGFLSRMSESLGLRIVADAFMELKRDPRLRNLQLAVMGGTLGDDVRFLERLRREFRAAGVEKDVAITRDFDKDNRLRFLQSLSTLSVPAPNGEAFGMYLLEAMACGIPVVQPKLGAFPEILETAGGGLLYEPNDPATLAATLQSLLIDPGHARALGAKGRAAVVAHFDVASMADKMVEVYKNTLAALKHMEF